MGAAATQPVPGDEVRALCVWPLLQGPLLPFTTAFAWPLCFLLASHQEGEESVGP